MQIGCQRPVKWMGTTGAEFPEWIDGQFFSSYPIISLRQCDCGIKCSLVFCFFVFCLQNIWFRYVRYETPGLALFYFLIGSNYV